MTGENKFTEHPVRIKSRSRTAEYLAAEDFVETQITKYEIFKMAPPQ